MVNPTKVRRLLGGRKGYQRLMLDGEGEGHKDEYDGQQDPRFGCTPEFVQPVERRMQEQEQSKPEVELANGVALLSSASNVDTARLRSSDRNWKLSRQRTIIWYVLTRRLGFRVNHVASYFGRAPQTVSSTIARFAETPLRHPTVSEKLDRLVDDFHQRANHPQKFNC